MNYKSLLIRTGRKHCNIVKVKIFLVVGEYSILQLNAIYMYFGSNYTKYTTTENGFFS